MRARIAAMHEAAAAHAALVPAVSTELVRLEHAAGREAALVPMSADDFPAPEGGGVVAISLGHLGRRTDWALLRAVGERMGDDLVALMVGAVHQDEAEGDGDFAAVRAMGQFVWLGALGDEAAARLILCADVGILPFRILPLGILPLQDPAFLSRMFAGPRIVRGYFFSITHCRGCWCLRAKSITCVTLVSAISYVNTPHSPIPW